MIKVFYTNLAKYNEGALTGQWLTLPMSLQELEQKTKEILGDDEEGFISDYEVEDLDNFKIQEYDSLDKLNDLAEELCGLDSEDLAKIDFILGYVSAGRDAKSLEYALGRYEDVIFYEDQTLEDVAETLVEEGCFGEVSDQLKNYIDYEAIARDLHHDGYIETKKGVFKEDF